MNILRCGICTSIGKIARFVINLLMPEMAYFLILQFGFADEFCKILKKVVQVSNKYLGFTLLTKDLFFTFNFVFLVSGFSVSKFSQMFKFLKITAKRVLYWGLQDYFNIHRIVYPLHSRNDQKWSKKQPPEWSELKCEIVMIYTLRDPKA